MFTEAICNYHLHEAEAKSACWFYSISNAWIFYISPEINIDVMISVPAELHSSPKMKPQKIKNIRQKKVEKRKKLNIAQVPALLKISKLSIIRLISQNMLWYI